MGSNHDSTERVYLTEYNENELLFRLVPVERPIYAQDMAGRLIHRIYIKLK